MVYQKCTGPYDHKDVNDWLDNMKVPAGCTKNNVTYLREFKDIYRQWQRTSVVLYFVANSLKDKNAMVMLASYVKQREFMKAVIAHLKTHQVTRDWTSAFDRELRLLRERRERIQQLLMNNLKYTKYYPFFAQADVDVFDVPDDLKNEAIPMLDKIGKECFEWTEAHPDIVEAHMDSMKEAIEKKRAHDERVKRKEQEEKEKKKKEEAEKKRLEKEREANLKRHKSEYDKLEKSFRRYYSPTWHKYGRVNVKEES